MSELREGISSQAFILMRRGVEAHRLRNQQSVCLGKQPDTPEEAFAQVIASQAVDRMLAAMEQDLIAWFEEGE